MMTRRRKTHEDELNLPVDENEPVDLRNGVDPGKEEEDGANPAQSSSSVRLAPNGGKI